MDKKGTIIMKKAQLLDNNRIGIYFNFDWDTVNTVKAIPGRKFHPEYKIKYWSCPLSPQALTILKKAGFSFSKELESKTEAVQDKYLPIDMIPDVEVKGLKRNLFPFQKKGVSFIESRNGRVLLADNMGLGKTIQSLAWLHLHPEKRPALIVCPAHLKLNWLKEINETLPGKQNVQVLFGGKENNDEPLTGDIVIVNYEIFHNKYEKFKDNTGKKRVKEIERTGWVDYILDIKPKVMIIDEAHKIKSNTAFRTKSIKKAAKKQIPHIIALTGTPIISRPIEGFNIAQIIDSSIFPNFWQYVHTYCGAKHTGYGWDFNGASNKEELHETLTNTIMIRRQKKDVLKDLPDKIYSYIPMQIDNTNEYQKAERHFIEFIKERKGKVAAERAEGAEHLTKIETLKQIAIKGKMDNSVKWINDFIEDNGKLVVFAIHKETINRLMKEFKNVAVKIDGSTSSTNRQKAIESFQNNNSTRLFIGNIQAAGTGITLTASSSVAFLELPWTPGDVTQAEDRVHRIGQKNSVNVYYLLADQTIEQEIAELLDKKRKVVDAILDGKETEEIKLFSELMKMFKNNRR